MIKKLLHLLYLSLPLFSEAVNFKDFDIYQHKRSYVELKERLDKYLIKDKEIEAYYTLTSQEFILYESPEAKSQGKEEYRLFLSPDNDKRPIAKEKRDSLKGVKIAIDPGHFGGDVRFLEERFIDITWDKKKRSFDEGTLTLLTALHLKELLEKEGAEVMLTKEEIGKGVYPQTFFEWLQINPSLWKNKNSLSKLFREGYNVLDLRARASKINAFRPDLTLILHYNAHEPEEKSSSLTQKNFNLVFVPGAFCKGELNEEEARYAFVRLLLSDDLETSRDFSYHILENMVRVLGVPSVAEDDIARYLDARALRVASGVYARNLVLTRLIQGTLCYGETLVQNNDQEILKLSKIDTQIQGIPCSFRVKEVALSYFEGIKAYFGL